MKFESCHVMMCATFDKNNNFELWSEEKLDKANVTLDISRAL